MMFECFNQFVLSACISSFTWHESQLEVLQDQLIRYDNELAAYEKSVSSIENDLFNKAEKQICTANQDYEISLSEPTFEKCEKALLQLQLANIERNHYEKVHSDACVILSNTLKTRLWIRSIFDKRRFQRVSTSNDSDATDADTVDDAMYEMLNFDDIAEINQICSNL